MACFRAISIGTYFMTDKILNKLIADVKTQLIESNLYTKKDLLLLSLLDDAYTLYLNAKEKMGNDPVITYLDYNKNEKSGINPYYTIALEQSKEIFKYLNALYLTPLSRKESNPLNKKDEPSPLEQALQKIGQS